MGQPLRGCWGELYYARFGVWISIVREGDKVGCLGLPCEALAVVEDGVSGGCRGGPGGGEAVPVEGVDCEGYEEGPLGVELCVWRVCVELCGWRVCVESVCGVCVCGEGL